MSGQQGTSPDGRRLRGSRTRDQIVRHAGDIASVHGLQGVTLSMLAAELGLSKSGVHALFGTKEGLQLATVSAARARFVSAVVNPVRGVQKGLPFLIALVDSWLDYVGRREFPGGCFVTHCVAEFAGQEGAVRNALLEARQEWLELIASHVRAAMEEAFLSASIDPSQLAFETDALLVAANTGMLIGDELALNHARDAIKTRLFQAFSS